MEEGTFAGNENCEIRMRVYRGLHCSKYNERNVLVARNERSTENIAYTNDRICDLWTMNDERRYEKRCKAARAVFVPTRRSQTRLLCVP